MIERANRLGTIEASSSTRKRGTIVAWAVAVKLTADEGRERVLIAAVDAERPDLVCTMLSAAPPAEAMAMLRSLVHRSGKRVGEGGLVTTQFGDLETVDFEHLAPQWLVGPASSWGLSFPDAQLAIACTWTEMALAPEAREAAIRARTPEGTSAGVLEPIERAIVGISRALRKANEPLLGNAVWTMQSLLLGHHDLARRELQELVLQKGMTEERRDLLGALVDELNPILVAASPETTPRVVLYAFRFAASSGERVAVGYFHVDGERSKLTTRHPEKDLSQEDVDAGFGAVGRVFRKHQAIVTEALAERGAFTMHRGFHADVSLEDALTSFKADGFTPVALVLDE